MRPAQARSVLRLPCAIDAVQGRSSHCVNLCVPLPPPRNARGGDRAVHIKHVDHSARMGPFSLFSNASVNRSPTMDVVSSLISLLHGSSKTSFKWLVETPWVLARPLMVGFPGVHHLDHNGIVLVNEGYGF